MTAVLTSHACGQTTQQIDQRSCNKNSPKNSDKVLLVSGLFYLCENQCFLPDFHFQAQDACQMQLPVQNWSRQGEYLGQPMLFEFCVLSLALECEMRGSLVYLLIVKYLLILFKFSHKIEQPYHGTLEGFFKTFLEGSVDHIIYWDNIVNWSSFIHCSLAFIVL